MSNETPPSMRLKIAFIDIDGVMIPLDGEHDDFSPEAVAACSALRDAGWYLVLISTWRSNAEQYMDACHLFIRHNIPLYDRVDPDEPSKAIAAQDYMLDLAMSNNRVTAIYIDDQDIGVAGAPIIRPASNVGLRLADIGRFAN